MTLKRKPMKLPNTPTNKQIQQVAATMAIENMPIPKEFIEKLAETNGDNEKLEALRQELIKEYKQPKP